MPTGPVAGEPLLSPANRVLWGGAPWCNGGAVCGAMMDPVENGPTPQDLWRVREGQGGGAGHALASAMGHRSGLGGEEGSRPREHSRSVPKAKKVSKKWEMLQRAGSRACNENCG